MLNIVLKVKGFMGRNIDKLIILYIIFAVCACVVGLHYIPEDDTTQQSIFQEEGFPYVSNPSKISDVSEFYIHDKTNTMYLFTIKEEGKRCTFSDGNVICWDLKEGK